MTQNALDMLVNETYSALLDAQAKAEQHRKDESARSRQHAIDTFAAALEEEIGADLVNMLGIEYEVVNTNLGGYLLVSAHFNESGSPFIITRQDNNVNWHVESRYRPEWSADWSKTCPRRKKGEDSEFRVWLLVGIGIMREKKAEADAKAEAKRVADAEREKEQNLRRAEQERAKNERLDAELTIHREIESEVEKSLAAARAAMWTWKAGVTITYYELSFCTGITYNDGEVSSDYETGWCAESALDADGFITFQPTWAYDRTPKTVKLDMSVHKPVWERLTAACVEDLPARLRQNVEIQMPGVTWFWSDSGKQLLSYYESGHETFMVAENGVPVAWVRELVEAS